MEKEFAIAVDITVSKILYIDAENEDEAVKKAEEMLNKNPYEYANKFDAVVSTEIIYAYEN